jgi:hypothetical protein
MCPMTADLSGVRTLDIAELRASRPDVDAQLRGREAENAELIGRVGGVRYTCAGSWIEHRLPGCRAEPTEGQCSLGAGCTAGDTAWAGHARFDSCHDAIPPCPLCADF